MRSFLSAAWVITRRDYVASVFSRSFLFFLIGPLLPVLVAAGLSSLGNGDNRPPGRPLVTVLATGGEARALETAATRLEGSIGVRRMPQVQIVAPEHDVWAQTRRLLGARRRGPDAVLVGGLEHPALFAPQDAIDDLDGRLALLVDLARQQKLFGDRIPKPVVLARHATLRAESSDGDDRRTIARGGQVVLIMLVLLLSGMLASNMIEEKSNKVIEVLVAAVPVDAIFAGKLAAMLAMSLTAILIWSVLGIAVATGAATLVLPAGSFGPLPVPAIGWPGFVLLTIFYFAASYLLVGGLLLGIGAQASTPREVQTLSMPLTMGQALVFGFASAAIGHQNGALGIAAAVFPWSSPFAMLARAAEQPEWWPHLLGLAWQALWLMLVIRIAAARFRRTVLQSGPPPKRRWLGKLLS